MNINNAYMNGKYTCPLLGFIWFVTILWIVAYKDSEHHRRKILNNYTHHHPVILIILQDIL